MATVSELEAKIKESVPDVSYISVVDVSDGCGGKFEATVVSSAFIGIPLLQQHRIVNKVCQNIL